jgi:hypothetical protein
MNVLEVSASPKPAKASAVKVTLLNAVSFPALMGTLLVVLVVAAVGGLLRDPGKASRDSVEPTIDVFEGDTWFHILVGEDILKTHTFPTTDSYTFTVNGNESMAFEWLGQILMALTDHLGGLLALTVLFFGAACTLLLLLYYYTSLRCGNSKAAFVACLPMAVLLATFFTLRPHLFGYIFLFLTLILIEHFRRGRVWALWLLPPLFVVWVNTHGSFVLGLLFLGFYWAAGLVRFQAGGLEAEPWTPRQRLHLEVVMLLCVLALVATPYGTRLAGFTLNAILNSSLGYSRIQEYLPLSGERLKIFVVLLLAFLAAQVVLRPKYRLDDFGLLLLTVYGTFVHKRLLVFCIPVFTPLLAALLARWVPKYDKAMDKYLLNAVLMAIAAVVVWVKFFPSRADLQKAVDVAFPRSAVEYLQRHPVQGRMMNPDFWGSYLILNLGRDHKIFMDGRSPLFEEAGVFEDYVRIIGLDRDTPLLLRKYRLDACLTYHWGSLATYLSALPDWEQVYQDNLAVIFVRKKPRAAQTQVESGKSKMETGKVETRKSKMKSTHSATRRAENAWSCHAERSEASLFLARSVRQKERFFATLRSAQNDSLHFDFPISIFEFPVSSFERESGL